LGDHPGESDVGHVCVVVGTTNLRVVIMEILSTRRHEEIVRCRERQETSIVSISWD